MTTLVGPLRGNFRGSQSGHSMRGLLGAHARFVPFPQEWPDGRVANVHALPGGPLRSRLVIEVADPKPRRCKLGMPSAIEPVPDFAVSGEHHHDGDAAARLVEP